MTRPGGLTFTIASEEWQFRQIHQLNRRAFVDEIPQHAPREGATLVDKFHAENTYIVCLAGDRVLGMVAVRDTRPFSLDAKLPDLDAYLPPGRALCEIRLLTVDRDRRHGVILRGLLTRLTEYAKARGYELGVISATVRQLGLYRRLGFVPFGPLVGTSEARFQPMHATTATFEERLNSLGRSRVAPRGGPVVNLLPGPVSLSPAVRAALRRQPVSHRSEAFKDTLRRTKRALRNLVRCRQVEILQGSGTLANDVIAAQLSREPGAGLVVSNGEFGDRLVDHASRFGLAFEALRVPWGHPVERGDLERALDARPDIRWLWTTHCETSTGVLNDLAVLADVCDVRGVRLCLDCVSSIGTVRLDLSRVYFASGASGKGLRAAPGLSMVFYNHELPPAPALLPRYLDLGLYAARDGVPFTCSSNLVEALHVAVTRILAKPPFARLARLSAWLRRELRRMNLRVVAPDAQASPAVITITLPPSINSEALGVGLDEAGFLLSYRSDYLLRRNWIQICLFGERRRADLVAVLESLRAVPGRAGDCALVFNA
jgi:aspartate aminotransferase-like enzyme/GNAT superfamily N-acetyltransferase